MKENRFISIQDVPIIENTHIYKNMNLFTKKDKYRQNEPVIQILIILKKAYKFYRVFHR